MNDPDADLAVAVTIVSSYYERRVRPGVVLIGTCVSPCVYPLCLLLQYVYTPIVPTLPLWYG